MLVLLWICGLQIFSPGGNFFNSPIRALGVSQVAQQLDLPPKAGDLGSILGLGRSLKEGNYNPPQYSCLENPVDRGARWATVHGIIKESDMT